jgi:hypothetical protein
MENQEDTNQIRDTLREWIGLDDQIRALQAQIKGLRDRKTALGAGVLEFMQGNNLDNFVIEGGVGTIAKSTRTVRPPLRRSAIRTQLLLQFADQPQRVADDMSVGGTQRVVLSRRLPRTQNINLQ